MFPTQEAESRLGPVSVRQIFLGFTHWPPSYVELKPSLSNTDDKLAFENGVKVERLANCWAPHHRKRVAYAMLFTSPDAFISVFSRRIFLNKLSLKTDS